MTRCLTRTSLFIIALVATHALQGQSVLQKKITFAAHQKTIADALFELSEAADVNLVFSKNFFEDDQKVSISAKNEPLEQVLKEMLGGMEVVFREQGGSILFFRKPLELFDLSGFVRDAETGESLPGASVFDPSTGNGTVTNGYGFFSLKIKKGQHRLVVSYIGYEKAEAHATVGSTKKKPLDLRLMPSASLGEVVVVSSVVAKKIQESPQQQAILMQRLSHFAAPGGEPDVLRHLQTLPGVQSGADGFGGLHIRGGNADQNLILLDDVAVFNPSHSAGLFSIFNMPTVKSATLSKGGFAARHGGRLSSVLDVRTREGSLERPSATLATSLIATSATIEAPIVKNRLSLLVGGRRSHVGAFLKNRSQNQKAATGGTGETGYFFFDANAKLHFRLSDKDRFYATFYTGGDLFDDFLLKNSNPDQHPNLYRRDSLGLSNDWGNRIGSLRWNHVFGERLFVNTTLVTSRFSFASDLTTAVDSRVIADDQVLTRERNLTRFSSDIAERAARVDFDFFQNEQNRLRFGAGATLRDFVPSILNSEIFEDFPDSMLSFRTPIAVDSTLYRGAEAFFYISNDWKKDNWEVNMGLYGGFFGSDSLKHFSPQPRLSLRYFLKNRTALTFSAARMTQFMHLLTTTDAGLPNDLWVPATKNVLPENAWVWTLGFQSEWGEKWLFNAEFYTKTMSGLLRYRTETPGGQQILADSWVELATPGSGASQGFEVLLEKHKGRVTGWLSYTASRTNRTFDTGKKPYQFDSRHTLHLVASLRLTRWLEANAGWSFQSGLPGEDLQQLRDNFLFSGIFEQGPASLRNGRLPAYHRLDVDLSATFRTGKWLRHQVSLGAYNVLNRKNAFFSFPTDPTGTEWRQVNALPFLPCLRWEVRVE
jgi:hypothetical protein